MAMLFPKLLRAAERYADVFTIPLLYIVYDWMSNLDFFY